MYEKSIILFKCRKKLNSKLSEKLLDTSQTVYTTSRINELKKLVEEKKYSVVLYDRKDRNKFIEIMNKIQNQNRAYSLIILTNNEARKFNFKKHQFERVIYISNPATLEELAQFVNLLFKIEELKSNLEETEKIVQAFESSSELSRKELMDAYKSLNAQEVASELSRKELIEANQSLSAWERLAEFARKERSETSVELEAFDEVLELSRQERLLADKIIAAWERTFELGREELLESYSKLKEVINEKRELLEKLIEKMPKSKKSKD